MKYSFGSTEKVVVFFALFLFSSVNAQSITEISRSTDQLRSACKVTVYSKNKSVPAFIKFTDEQVSSKFGAMSLLAATLEMSADDKLQLLRSEKDDLGFIHYRYQQYYKNVKVESGQYLVHEKNGLAISANGNWVDHININATPSVSEHTASQNAQKYILEKTYGSSSKGQTLSIGKIAINEGELIIAAEDLDFEKNDLRLCYKFDVQTDRPLSKTFVYIDANTGKTIASESEIEFGSVTATATTMYSGTQTIKADSVSASSFRLRDATRGLGIETYNTKNTTNLAAAVDFTSTSTVFNTVTNKDNAAYDVQWAMESAYDYFLNVHGRNSVDNAGKKLISYAHYSSPGTFDAGRIGDGVFGFNDGTGAAGGFNPLTSIDIVSHEMTHGITFHTAGLHYGGESAALNESFSDIFGTCVEFYKKPATADFQLGEQAAVTPGTVIRSLANPKLTNLPNTYKGTNWYLGGNDYGGAHTNCGVQDFWFYLLCQGGSGTNDISNSYSVSAIGMTKAAKIAYRTLTVYLTSFSKYAEARDLSIQAAADLYGTCSAEVAAVTNAWYAVGVGAAYSASVVAAFTSNGVFSCSVPFTVRFTNTSVNDSTAVWDFGDGSSSSAMNPSHTYTMPGTYNVKLISSSCEGKDSVIKNSYITISTPTSPTVQGAASCSPSAFVLKASGSGTVNWYSAATGGTAFHTGGSFTTPVLDSTTTYYAEDEIAGTKTKFGPSNWAGQYGTTIAQYVNFTILQSAILRTVRTNSYLSGKRNIQIRDNIGNIVFDSIYDLPLGTVTIPFNVGLAPGAYHIGGDSLYFAFDGTNNSYPYTLANVASITGNTVANAFYILFYDWEIETAPCKSMRTPVTATIYKPPVVSLKLKVDTLCEKASPITLSGGLPAGGSYSGAGVKNGVFDPAIGIGDNLITYTYTDEHGCTNAIAKSILVVKDPMVTLLIPKDTLCEKSSAIPLSGGKPIGGVYFGMGVKNNVFDPALTGNGEFLISYSYSDSHSCSNNASQKIFVVKSPVVSLKLSTDTLCNDASPLTLTGGIPAGGTYSGIAVKNGAFDPGVSGKGTFLITYSFSDENSCTVSASQNIIVKSCTITDVKNNDDNDNVKVFSEAGTGKITIILQNEQSGINAQFEIFNTIGGKIFTASLFGEKTELHHDLASGIYFYRIKLDNKIISGKLIIM